MEGIQHQVNELRSKMREYSDLLIKTPPADMEQVKLLGREMEALLTSVSPILDRYCRVIRHEKVKIDIVDEQCVQSVNLALNDIEEMFKLVEEIRRHADAQANHRLSSKRARIS